MYCPYFYDEEYFESMLRCPYRQQFSPGPPPFGGGPGGPPPFGGGMQGGPPSGPPPSFTPSKKSGPELKAVDPGAIRPCTFRYIYIWLDNGRSFWAYLVYVGRTSVAGWRWTGRRWVYFGVDTRRIESFICY
ncbi:hypothetical protein [Clostridium tetanomorphum]|nr:MULTISPECIES: hypothetical protein [Clostridium]NRZ95512.1 hypothetical protein [Clostridium tetanomorphum]